MQHLTGYSDAWDREGEREDAKQERIEAIHAELTGDYETLKALIVESLAGKDKSDLVEALAYQMAANWARRSGSDWWYELSHSLVVDDTASVADILKREIAARMIIEGDKP